MVLVEGRPGFGKTHLLDEVAESALGRGIRVGRGSVTVSEQTVPLAVLSTALFDGAQPVLDRGERARLHQLPEQRYLLLDELESLLERAAMRFPLLLCLDDMQWADSVSRAALRSLPVRLAASPIVWLVAYRPGRESGELRRAVEGLVNSGAPTCVLGPLDAAATGQVVRDVMRAKPDDALLSLAQRAHGNPFLLVELLRGLLEEALVAIESDRVRLVDGRLPARVSDSMRDRLARMTDFAIQVADVASVLDRSFSFDQLARMLDVAPAPLLAPVGELLSAEILSQHEDALTFRHDLLRQAVRDTLPASALRALQRQAVDVQLETGAQPAEVAAQLAACAVPGDQIAVRTLHDAAHGLAQSDPSAAADLSAQALELAGADTPARGPLAAQTVLLLHAAGRINEGKALANALLSQTLPVEQEAEVRLSLADMVGLSPDERAEAGLRALALPGLPASMRARHLAYLVRNLAVAGRVADAWALLPEARKATRTGDDPTATVAVQLAEATLEYLAGDLPNAYRLIDAVTNADVYRGEPVRTVLVGTGRSAVLAALDRYDESMAQTVEQLALAQRDRQGVAERMWEGWRGSQLLQLGQLSDAAAALEGIVESPSAVTYVGLHDAAVVAALGTVAIHTGDPRQLERCVTAMRDLASAGPPNLQRLAAWLLARKAMAGGDPAAARRELCAIGEDARHTVISTVPMDFTAGVTLARIARAAGDTELVRTAVASAAELADRNPTVASIVGTAAHTRGLATSDPADFGSAVSSFERSPRPLALASALEDAGRAEVGIGKRDDGVAILGRALEIYSRCGASWDARRVRRRLRELGVRRRIATTERPARGWAGMTDSELEVVRRVSAGMTNREVAERLFVSTHTVSTHLRHVFAKLGISSRVELARIAAEHDVTATNRPS